MNSRRDVNAVASFAGSEKGYRAGRDLDRARALFDRANCDEFMLVDGKNIAKPSDGAPRGEDKPYNADRQRCNQSCEKQCESKRSDHRPYGWSRHCNLRRDLVFLLLVHSIPQMAWGGLMVFEK